LFKLSLLSESSKSNRFSVLMGGDINGSILFKLSTLFEHEQTNLVCIFHQEERY